jgi:hypothetical protein
MDTLVLLKYIQNGECFLKFPYVCVGLNCLTNLIFKRANTFHRKGPFKGGKVGLLSEVLFRGQVKSAIQKFMSVSGF